MEILLTIDNITPKNTLRSYNGKVSALIYSVGNKTKLERLVEDYSDHYKDLVSQNDNEFESKVEKFYILNTSHHLNLIEVNDEDSIVYESYN